MHASADIGGVHFVLLDVVRYFEPTEDHPSNWHVLADEGLLEWLAADLAGLDRATPLVVASHVPISTTFPQRADQVPDMAFPTNEIAGARRLLTLLQPFERGDHLARPRPRKLPPLRRLDGGYDHRGGGGQLVEDGTGKPRAARTRTAGVSGGRGRGGKGFQEPVPRLPATPRRRRWNCVGIGASGRRFVNVFDGSPRTQVEVGDLGPLAPIDPLAESSRGLATHLWELPADFDRQQVEVRVVFEDGRECSGVLEERVWE